MRILRWTLLLEELLLSYRDRDSSAWFELTRSRLGRSITIKLSVSGEKFDAMHESGSLITENTLGQFDVPPGYSYASGKNIITYHDKVTVQPLVGLKFVWTYMRKDLRRLIVTFIVQLLLVGFGILIPLITARQLIYITDSLILPIIIASVAVMLSYMVNYFLEYVDKHYFIRIYNSVLKDVEADIAGRVMHLEKSCIDEYGSGLFIRRLTTDAENISAGIGDALASAIQIMVSLGSIVACMIICFPAGCALFVIVTVVFLLEYMRFIVKADDDRCYRKSSEKYTALINEMISANLDIKILHAEKNCLDDLARSIDEANDKRSLIEERSQRYILGRKLIKEVMDFFYIVILVVMMVTGTVSPAVAIILVNLKMNSNDIGWYFTVCLDALNNITVSGERLSHLTSDADFPMEKFGDKHISQYSGNVVLEHVAFTYPGRKKTILKDVSFSAQPGEKIAITGKSGSGKSTLLYLINKLYTIDGGRIMLDGNNINDLDESSIRDNISMVPQFPVLFNASVRENLTRIGNEVTEEEIINACRMACIYDDIMGMPEGFDTIIGEKGYDLSGGQRQRLAIARCILRKTGLLLLDEATSSLDNNTQNLIIKAIGNIGKNCTVITVAHRLSTIAGSDRIFFLSEGEIADSGTHEELLERCEAYRELCSEL